MFDLEPYIPLQVFAPLALILIGGIAVWGVDRKKGK